MNNETYPDRRTLRLRVLHTSDVHGHVLDALPQVAAYAQDCRERMGHRHVLLTDGGDTLQGGPYAYYYNFIDTRSPHLVAEVMNRAGYDVAVIGNHDIEQGHAVYDRFVSQCRFPVLGANVIDGAGESYFQPYQLFDCEGVRIAVLGLLTPVIPHWVPRPCWSGLAFEEMVAAARRWVTHLQAAGQPDLIIGLFHSGFDADQGICLRDCCENAVRQVAEQVAGFDLILYGHDHRQGLHYVDSPSGRPLLCAAPTSTGACTCQIDIDITLQSPARSNDRARVLDYQVSAQLLPTASLCEAAAAQAFRAPFDAARLTIERYMATPVGELTQTLQERDAFFGPSVFMTLIHDLQLALSAGAQISFAAPVSFDATIPAGPLQVRDMYALYKYENLLCTLRLTGREVRDFLEMSYALWCDTMHAPSDHILLMDYVLDHGRRLGLKNMAFNFDSAAGIRYTVDASQPIGQKVVIQSMEDGTPFELDREYRVAMNSYRACGGGELLTRGAGIALDALPARMVACSEHDLRYLFADLIRRQGRVEPRCNDNWRFIPEAWAPAALTRDRQILFFEK